MAIQRVESVYYRAGDVEDGIRYFDDWGLETVETGASGAVFRTQENQFIHLRGADDDSLAGSPESGPTLCETVWGVDGKVALDAIGAELSSDREVKADADGTLHSTDETGFSIAFRLSDRVVADLDAPQVNLNDSTPRFNVPIDPERRVRPIRLGHVVFNIPSEGWEKAAAFYIDRLNFRLTDRANDTGSFMRCEGGRDHHNLFLAHRPNRAGINHTAYEVRDFDDIMFGGKYMKSRGWTPNTKPGRHIMGSNLFWYFKNPSGGVTEYFADMDRMDDSWQPRIWENTPGFAMWVIDDD
jgi:catechol 2,3-dioxygenase-like lactoylglutathione lyase family enzyme